MGLAENPSLPRPVLHLLDDRPWLCKVIMHPEKDVQHHRDLKRETILPYTSHTRVCTYYAVPYSSMLQETIRYSLCLGLGLRA